MTLLALDTSTEQTGLALYDGDKVQAELTWFSHRRQTVELAPSIKNLLESVGVSSDAIQAVGVAIGPGSFTSLRVGLALAKGLALAGHIPLIGVPTLDILAAAIPVEEFPLAAVLQAGRGRLAVGWYQANSESWKSTSPAYAATAAELVKSIKSRTLVCGELQPHERQQLARKYRKVIIPSPANCVRRPGILAEVAWNRWKAGEVDSAAPLAPIYLQTSGITSQQK